MSRLRRTTPPGPLELTPRRAIQTCNDKMCLPPRRATATASTDRRPPGRGSTARFAAGYTLFDPAAPRPQAPAAAESQRCRPAAAPSQGLFMFLLVAFGFGLAAIFTPCVFPMIPITVSFFLNKPAGGARQERCRRRWCSASGSSCCFPALGLAATAIAGTVRRGATWARIPG